MTLLSGHYTIFTKMHVTCRRFWFQYIWSVDLVDIAGIIAQDYDSNPTQFVATCELLK